MSHATRPPPTATHTERASTDPGSPGPCSAVALAAQILVVLDISVVNTALPVHRHARCTSTAASCSGWSRPT